MYVVGRSEKLHTNIENVGFVPFTARDMTSGVHILLLGVSLPLTHYRRSRRMNGVVSVLRKTFLVAAAHALRIEATRAILETLCKRPKVLKIKNITHNRLWKLLTNKTTFIDTV